MHNFTRDVIEAVTREYLKGVMVEASDEVVAANKARIYKKQAERLLKLDVFKYAIRKVAAQTKDILLLRASTPEEVLVNRGVLLGLQALEKELLAWTAGGKAQKEGEEEDDES